MDCVPQGNRALRECKEGHAQFSVQTPPPRKVKAFIPGLVIQSEGMCAFQMCLLHPVPKFTLAPIVFEGPGLTAA